MPVAGISFYSENTGMSERAIPDLLLVGGPPFFAETSSPRRLLARAWRRLGGRVLYVELMGDREPFRRRAIEKGRPVEAEPGLWVERLEGPLGLPWSYPEALRRHNLRLRLRSVREATERVGFERNQFIALLYGWYWDDWIGRLGARKYVYDCIDEHRAYAHVAGRPRRVAHVWAAEKRMLEKVDLLAVTSETLLTDRAPVAKSHLFLPHAVDTVGYEGSVRGGLDEPAGLGELPRPRAVLMGNMQPKLDFAVVESLASKRPDWGVALVGPVERYTQLPEERANLKHFGKQPYETLPRFLRHTQVGLIPLLDNAYNKASSPLKLLEYLAGGLPVVASRNPIIEPWAKKHPDIVHAVPSGDDWVGACEAAFEAGEKLGRKAIAKLVQDRTYEARIRTLLAALK